MIKLAIPSLLLLLSATSAFAACPPPLAGSTAEVIAANQQRVICLQQELSVDTSFRKLELDIEAQRRILQDIQMQQRMNALPRPVEVPVYRP